MFSDILGKYSSQTNNSKFEEKMILKQSKEKTKIFIIPLTILNFGEVFVL